MISQPRGRGSACWESQLVEDLHLIPEGSESSLVLHISACFSLPLTFTVGHGSTERAKEGPEFQTASSLPHCVVPIPWQSGSFHSVIPFCWFSGIRSSKCQAAASSSNSWNHCYIPRWKHSSLGYQDLQIRRSESCGDKKQKFYIKLF